MKDSALPVNVILLILFSVGIVTWTRAQEYQREVSPTDTFAVKAGNVIWIADSSFIVLHDTVLVSSKSRKVRIESKPDIKTESFYRSIRDQADKNILTRTLGNLVFIRSRKESEADTVDFRVSVEYFLPYTGKQITRIEYKKVDVLSGSVWDTTEIASSLVSHTLNAVHVKTKDHIITNNLLFKEGDTLQPVNLADTERILRSLPSIEDAKIYVIPSLQDTTDVSLMVVTKDIFSWGLGLTLISANKYRLKLVNRNLLGWGVEIKYALMYDQASSPYWAHDFQSKVYNIGGSFISGTLRYIDSQKSQIVGLSFNRDLISPQIKYIGSVDVNRIRDLHMFSTEDMVFSKYIKYFNQDVWIGRVLLLGKLKERKNLIFSGRVNRIQFIEHPDISGIQSFLYNTTQLFGRLSLAHINYLKTRMIYSFDRTEDIPYGFLAQLTTGYEISELTNRYYFSSDFSWADRLKRLGYLGLSAEFGIFKRAKSFEQGVLNLRLLFFSQLINFNRFHLRQIIKLGYTNGINRTTTETIDLKDKLTGLSAHEPKGRSNLVANLETVTFTPWNFYGFRFAVFGYADFALFASRALISSATTLYSIVGFGCRLKNESLVMNTLNIRIGYFIRHPQGMGLWTFEIVNDTPEISQGLLGLKPAVAQYR